MTSYVVGDLATVVTDEGVVLAAGDRLAEVASLRERGLDPLTVVEVLSRGTLSDLPDFAAVRVDGTGVRILVRGSFVVRVDGFAVDGLQATTWNEATAALGPDTVVELLPLGTTSPGVVLPLVGGVVRSAGVTWHPAARPAAADAPAPAAAVAPPAAPPAPPAAPSAPPAPPAPPAPFVPVAEPAHHHTVARMTPPVPHQAPPAPPPFVPAGAPPVPAAAPPAPPAPPSAPPSAPSSAPPAWFTPQPTDPSAEHDGRTITPAQLQALRAEQDQPVVVPPAQRTQPSRPVVALQLSNGRTVQVRRRVLIGRSPRVQQVGGSANLPALVTVDDPYVSSTHLEVAADGNRVTATDTSTNGTLITRRGRAPVPLDPGVATEIGIGDVLTLSKGLTVTLVPAPER